MICSATVSSRQAARAGRCHGAQRTRTVSMAAVKAPSRLQEVAQGAAALAIAVGLALAPAPALAALPDGFKGPVPQELDTSLLSKLEKLDSIVDQDPSGAPISVETTYERQPLNASASRAAAPPAPAPAPAAEEAPIDIRQAAIEAAASSPTAAAPKAAAPAKVQPSKSAAPASSEPGNGPSPALIGGGIAVVAVAAVAAGANKGEEQQQAAPAAPAAPAPTAEPAAPAAAEGSSEPASQ